MVYGLPAHGDPASSGWDQKFIDSITAVKAIADVAQPSANRDADVAGDVGNASSATSAALTAAYERVFTAEAEGTVGSGDDTTVLQAALVKARAAKGVLRLTPGVTYIVSGALDPTGVRLEGRGAIIKIKNSTTPTYSVLTPTDACVIENLTIDLNKANTTDPTVQTQGNGLLMSAASWTGLVVRNVTIQNGHQVGIQILSTGGGTSGGATTVCPTLLDRVTVTGCTVANFSIKTVSGVTARDCKSSGSGGPNFYGSVVGNLVVTGLRSSGGSSGLFVEYGTNVTVQGGIFESNTFQGIAIGGGSTTLQENRYISLIGNTCRNNGTLGITLDPTKTGSPNTWVAMYATVEGNVCQGNGSDGINLENVGYVSVNGNVCHGNTGIGLRIIGAYVNASGNTLTSNTTYGLAVYGVATFDNGHHRFGANTAIGNTVADLDVAQIASGVVADVITTVPGRLRMTDRIAAAVDTSGEVQIGPVGPGGEAAIDVWGEKIYRNASGVLRTPSWWRVDGNLQAGFGAGGGFADGHLTIGSYHLWVDTSGRLRIKSSAPASDTDGTVVGAQV